MSSVSLLRKIINDKHAVVPVRRNNGRNSVCLTEKKASDSSFTIIGLPPDSIVIRADEFPAPRKFFKGEKGENKRADFIVVSESEKNWIVYIEMKSGEGGPEEEIIQQLKGAECVVAYCRSVAEKFHGETNLLDKKQYKPRFVSIRSTAVRKKPAAHSTSKVHDNPENMLKLKNRKKAQFNRLVGKHS